jgi:hypothetical protein
MVQQDEALTDEGRLSVEVSTVVQGLQLLGTLED